MSAQVVYLHRTSLDIYYLSFDASPHGPGFYDLRRHYGEKFTDETSSVGPDRADVLAWAAARSLDVVEVNSDPACSAPR